jgi:ubiquinone/menaquinone biosynthesis C-methylase UbiE
VSTWQDPDDNEIRYFNEFMDVENRRVLEIGAGDGRLIWRYAGAAAQVIGIDPDADGLQDALQDCPPELRSRVAFAVAQAEAIPFARQRFDRAVLAWSL